MFKSATFFAALAGTFYFHSGLKKKWQFYDRFYPEPTALQREGYLRLNDGRNPGLARRIADLCLPT